MCGGCARWTSLVVGFSSDTDHFGNLDPIRKGNYEEERGSRAEEDDRGKGEKAEDREGEGKVSCLMTGGPSEGGQQESREQEEPRTERTHRDRLERASVARGQTLGTRWADHE